MESLDPSSIPLELSGRSTAASELREQVRLAAADDDAVMIVGEPGTRRGSVGRVIHDLSRRSGRTFAVVPSPDIDARKLADVLAETAGGTLLIRDLDASTDAAQTVVSRALARRLAARIIVTARPSKIEALARPLLERIPRRVIVRPLRDRKDDIPQLTVELVRKFAARLATPAKVLSPEALSTLAAHPWPENFSELERVVERAVASAAGDTIGIDSLPPELFDLVQRFELRSLADLPYREFLVKARERITREYVVELLRRHRGSVTRAAAHAGIERESFHRLMKRYAISAHEHRDRNGRP